MKCRARSLRRVPFGSRPHPTGAECPVMDPLAVRGFEEALDRSRRSTGHIQYNGASGFSTRCQFRHEAASAPCSSDVVTRWPRPLNPRARRAGSHPERGKVRRAHAWPTGRGKIGPSRSAPRTRPSGAPNSGYGPGRPLMNSIAVPRRPFWSKRRPVRAATSPS